MSLRFKTLLVGCIILVALGVMVLVAADVLVLRGFADIEESDMREDLQRVANLLAYDLASMSATAADWAEWDDTYQYVVDANPDFANSNLVPETLTGLDFSALFLIDTSGKVVFGQAVDAETGEFVDPPAGFDTLLQPGSALLVHETDEVGRAGLVALPSGLVAVAANDILTSLDEGPARGTLIWVRNLDTRSAEWFGLMMSLPISLHAADDATLPDDVRAAMPALVDNTTYVAADGAETLSGYLRVDDVNGDPALILRLQKPRTMMAHGMRVVQTLVATLMVGGVLSLVFMVTALHKVMLNRIARLTTVVSHVRQSGDLTVEVPGGGSDELGQLISGFGAMLRSLRQTREALRQSRDELERRVIQRTAELRQAKEDAEAIFSNTSDAVVQVGLDYRIVRANPAFERMFGHRWDAMAGQPVELVVPVAERDKLFDAFASVADTHSAGRLDLTVQHSDSSTFETDVALSSVFEDDGQLRSIIAVFRDVTERKAAEARQARLIVGLRRVLSLGNDLIASEDADELCRRSVAVLQSELGLERCAIFLARQNTLQGTYGVNGQGEIVDEHGQQIELNDAIWKSRRQLTDPSLARWLVVDEPQNEWDGQEVRQIGHGWVAITPIMASRGFLGILVNDAAMTGTPPDPLLQETVAVFCSMFGSMYEHKRAEEAVKAALDRQIELNSLKMRFVSMVSHEFRTPLAVIQTSTDILQRYRDRISDERRDEYLEEMQRQVQQMKSLMEDYLILDRADYGHLRFEPKRTNIVTLCRQAIDESRLTSPRRVIQFRPPFEAFEIEVDTGLVHQALANLLTNAVKYSEEPSVVTVEMDKTDDALILRVRDRGIGIPEAEQASLFQSFFRASNAHQRPGTGLGLAIVKRAVEAHGGSVAFESHEGVGTTFTLTFPLEQPASVAADA